VLGPTPFHRFRNPPAAFRTQAPLLSRRSFGWRFLWTGFRSRQQCACLLEKGDFTIDLGKYVSECHGVSPYVLPWIKFSQ
jgi:hypothetical protein